MADRRFIDPTGRQWDSKYEYQVYEHLRLLGYDVRKCSAEEGDTLAYTSNVRKARCLECQSDQVVQDRTYTPDLHVSDLHRPGATGTMGSYLECKGYWKPAKRNLSRSFVRSNPDINLVFVFQNNGWITKGKSRYTDYVNRYFKSCSCVVWRQGQDFSFFGG